MGFDSVKFLLSNDDVFIPGGSHITQYTAEEANAAGDAGPRVRRLAELPRPVGRVGQTGRPGRLPLDLPLHVRRRGGAGPAGVGEGPGLRLARAGHHLRQRLRGRGVRHHPGRRRRRWAPSPRSRAWRRSTRRSASAASGPCPAATTASPTTRSGATRATSQLFVEDPRLLAGRGPHRGDPVRRRAHGPGRRCSACSPGVRRRRARGAAVTPPPTSGSCRTRTTSSTSSKVGRFYKPRGRPPRDRPRCRTASRSPRRRLRPARGIPAAAASTSTCRRVRSPGPLRLPARRRLADRQPLATARARGPLGALVLPPGGRPGPGDRQRRLPAQRRGDLPGPARRRPGGGGLPATHRAELGLGPGRTVAWGVSAGGHLAALAALDPAGPPRSTRSRAGTRRPTCGPCPTTSTPPVAPATGDRVPGSHS